MQITACEHAELMIHGRRSAE